MILFFYNLALLVALVAGAPWWLWKMATTHKYRVGMAERLGRVRAMKREPGRPVIWLHAVSVGEVLAVSRLVGELDRVLPEFHLLISTTTRTGQELARQRFGAERVFYCPLDRPGAVRAYLNGWFAHVGRTQTAVFPPPLPGASSCSNPGANWLTCSISGTTLTLGRPTQATPHQVIGTCDAATSFGPCALVAGDLPSISLTTGVTGTLQAAQEPAHTGDMTNAAGSLATTVVGLNGTLLSGLSSGLLKITTGTGALSIAGSADILSACTTCLTSASSLTSTALMTGAGSQVAQTTTTKLNGGVFYPTTDSTAAIQFDKANGTSNVLTVATTDGYVGIGT